jgi:hypothetical protein
VVGDVREPALEGLPEGCVVNFGSVAIFSRGSIGAMITGEWGRRNSAMIDFKREDAAGNNGTVHSDAGMSAIGGIGRWPHGRDAAAMGHSSSFALGNGQGAP